ncbi:MAG TPA: hypothetical protein VL240_01045 [Candidatus Binatia bacterium]|nr:hypothetical protein [Candidatus Binatia bacterium]
MPLEEKRLIAEKLISITLCTFNLCPEERSRITIQFVPRKRSFPAGDPLHTSKPSDVLLEVSDRDLTVEKVTAFVNAAAPMLSHSAALSRRSRIARMLGLPVDASSQIAFQFREFGCEKEEKKDKNDIVCDHFSAVPLRRAA